MKILFEKNLTPVVNSIQNDAREHFCGACANKLLRKPLEIEICPRCGARNFTSWNRAVRADFTSRYTISENEDKLFINRFRGKVHLCYGKFRFSKTVEQACFNFKTGQAYLLPVLNGQTYRPLRKKGNGIKNVSYNPYALTHLFAFGGQDKDIESAIFDIFKTKAKKYLQYEDEFRRLEDTEKPLRLEGTLLCLTKYKYSDKKAESIMHSGFNDLPGKVKKYWLRPQERENIEETLKVKFSKFAWEAISKDFTSFGNGFHVGYLKPDNQCKVLEIESELRKDLPYILNNSSVSDLVKFIKLYSDENAGIKRLQKLLIGNFEKKMYFMDTVSMLEDLKKAGFDIKPLLKLNSLKDMHDVVMIKHNEMRQMNREIYLSNSDKKLNDENGSYTFTVCNETDQLVRLGETMHICVGSYGDRAVNKYCLIVYGEKEGKLFTCIEVRDKSLVQVKGYCNHLLNEEDQAAVKAWAKSKGLKFDKCIDLN